MCTSPVRLLRKFGLLMIHLSYRGTLTSPGKNLSSVKCNMASSWLSRTCMGGAAWILRNHNGTLLLHSRRAYSSVVSPLHADILRLHWAVESMRNLRQTRVIFEFS
uniref:RNase H type-1 domain-containing protein n=1 Tax=Brassica oleracea TaxID=3712 RepID=A0A3P6GQU6_BRAOL|nr:unnamed protein product [Brassica oleracea]